MALAISTNWFLANFTFERIFQNVVAHSAYQFWQEGCHVCLIVYVVFLVNIASMVL